jgi:undecaprenyl-diphosphatase
MELVKSVILGVIEGICEFWRISSSGNLIVFRDILDIQVYYGLACDAVLQLATTFAVLVYFRKDIFGYIKTFFRVISKKRVEDKEKTLLWETNILT